MRDHAPRGLPSQWELEVTGCREAEVDSPWLSTWKSELAVAMIACSERTHSPGDLIAVPVRAFPPESARCSAAFLPVAARTPADP